MPMTPKHMYILYTPVYILLYKYFGIYTVYIYIYSRKMSPNYYKTTSLLFLPPTNELVQNLSLPSSPHIPVPLLMIPPWFSSRSDFFKKEYLTMSKVTFESQNFDGGQLCVLLEFMGRDKRCCQESHNAPKKSTIIMEL